MSKDLDLDEHIDKMPCHSCQDSEICNDDMAANCKVFNVWCEELWSL